MQAHLRREDVQHCEGAHAGCTTNKEWHNGRGNDQQQGHHCCDECQAQRQAPASEEHFSVGNFCRNSRGLIALCMQQVLF